MVTTTAMAQAYRQLQEQGTLKLHQFWFLKHRDAAQEEQRVHAALLEATTLTAREIVERSLRIASDICIYTNAEIAVEELE